MQPVHADAHRVLSPAMAAHSPQHCMCAQGVITCGCAAALTSSTWCTRLVMCETQSCTNVYNLQVPAIMLLVSTAKLAALGLYW